MTKLSRPVTGFSLFELIIVCLISAILLSISIPSFSELLMLNRPQRALTSLDRHLSYARLKSIYSGERITLCPLVEGKCTRELWHGELTLFIDRGKLKEFNGADTTLRVMDQIPAVDELTYPRRAITFKHTGNIWGLGNGTFVYCIVHHDGTKSGKALSLSITGRTTLKDTHLCD
ncbi:GspH/FimT family pseudopilin [Pseudoalteromonas sp. SMS1]|uniref:GspH/FimT family pseudopilin n=1 Tax=Pseudoalteromonas sp. SMS1 TaxID=2908894 RepID=UPI001F341D4C|nr:GspH/FimT family pseudopilin [Pseudoalteromonas sp. SMS1]MCF2856331.1 GspH/FimT family pseudopilin [Pseudoalteromonas sp. SMS1]